MQTGSKLFMNPQRMHGRVAIVCLFVCLGSLVHKIGLYAILRSSVHSTLHANGTYCLGLACDAYAWACTLRTIPRHLFVFGYWVFSSYVARESRHQKLLFAQHIAVPCSIGSICAFHTRLALLITKCRYLCTSY